MAEGKHQKSEQHASSAKARKIELLLWACEIWNFRPSDPAIEFVAKSLHWLDAKDMESRMRKIIGQEAIVRSLDEVVRELRRAGPRPTGTADITEADPWDYVVKPWAFWAARSDKQKSRIGRAAIREAMLAVGESRIVDALISGGAGELSICRADFDRELGRIKSLGVPA